MDELLKLVCDYQYGYGDERRKNDRPLSEIIVELEKLFKVVSLNDVHTSRCICGCKVKSTFWERVSYASVRIDILQWLIEQKHIDLETNLDMQNRMLRTFCDLLNKSGACNTPEMPEELHNMTMFFFDLLTKYPSFLERAKIYRTEDYGVSLLHAVFYGYDYERKKVYANRLIDIGITLMLTNAYYEDDELRDQIAKCQLNNVGQSPIYLAALEDPVILKRMLQMPNADVHLLSYDSYYLSTSNHGFFPIIPRLLVNMSTWKQQKYIQEVADCIKILLEDGRVDLTLPICYGKSDAIHNITDILHYYGFCYPDSPVMQVFSDLGIELPPQLDIDFKNFCDDDRMKSWKGKESPYDVFFGKYRYTKDPTQFPCIRAELEEMLASGINFTEDDEDNDWRNVPIVNEFIVREVANARERARMNMITDMRTRAQMNVNYVDDGGYDDYSDNESSYEDSSDE